MVNIEPYTEEFEKEYLETVNKLIGSYTQDYILRSSRSFLPEDFFEQRVPLFSELVLAPFEKLKKAQSYIAADGKYQIMKKVCFVQRKDGETLSGYYQKLVDTYGKVANSVKDGYSMRVRMVRNSGLTVCPYCNRDYINSRGKKVAGAQLDHFFGKNSYPLFSVCLYNLVPVCGNCNRIKGKQTMELISPFNKMIDWEKDIIFDYETEVESPIRILINSKDKVIKNDIKKMRIEEAYQIHSDDVNELLEKNRIYSETQKQEFKDVLDGINVSEHEIKLAIFGPKITKETMRTKPLGKMMSDLHKKLGIY